MAGLQGRTLGGYQLTEQIASAGIAEVYRARPLAANGREVVIKVIYPEFARYPSFLPNFQHIVQTAARLANHPHILPVVASGEENGYLYLATPWVADGTLRDWMARGGRLGVSDAGPFFHQLCGALAYAHSLGLVHGNLKPSNVFLYEGRHVMLGDFGMLWDIRQLDMNHSGSGADVVEYLAPESFGGQFTQQSDIYSLGAILFATLTGRPPFSASKPADLRDAHMQYSPPRLSQADPSLPPGVQALDPVVQQAMAKRPEDRFPSAMALAQAIDTILKQQPPIGPAHPAPALPAAQPFPQAMAQAQQPGMPSGGLAQPGVLGSWAAPGPIQRALPAPGAGIRPLDPPFPPLANGHQPEPPLAQGWPAQPEQPLAQGWPAAQPQPPFAAAWPAANPANDVQYTERVPAPPVARPLLAPPRDRSSAGGTAGPSAPPLPEPTAWPPQNIPAMSDDPDWLPDGPLARQADDWRGGHNGSALARGSRNSQSQSNFPSEYSEYTGQSVALTDDGYGASRGDWYDGVRSGPHSEALRYHGGFSATELGLPRLTNPALQGELPPEWEDLLAGEMLPSRDDVRPGGPRKPPPSRHNAPDSYAYSSAGDPYTADRAAVIPRGQHGRPVDDGLSYWQPAVGKSASQRDQPLPTLASAQYPAYGASRAQPESSSRGAPAKRAERPQGKRRWPAITLLLVVVLTLVGSTGVVLARPTLCPGTICTQANTFLHHRIGFLGPAPNANVLHVAPSTLTIHATAGSSTNLNVQVLNSGTDVARWQASSNITWLTITPASGSLPPGGTATLGVVANPVNVKSGDYTAQVRIETPDTAVNIPVTASVVIGAQIHLSATTLEISSCGSPQQLKINNIGDVPLSYNATPSDAKLVKLDKTSGSVNPNESVTLSVTIACAAPWADYKITVSSNGGDGAVTIHYP